MPIQSEPVAHAELVSGGVTSLHSHAGGGGGGGVNLLIDLSPSGGQASTGSWATVNGMTGTVNVTAGSLVHMVAAVPIEMRADDCVEFSFAVDGVREGPVIPVFVDATGEGCGLDTLSWYRTGLSGSHTLSLQWKTVANQHGQLDTTRNRTFQVVEFLA